MIKSILDHLCPVPLCRGCYLTMGQFNRLNDSGPYRSLLIVTFFSFKPCHPVKCTVNVCVFDKILCQACKIIINVKTFYMHAHIIITDKQPANSKKHPNQLLSQPTGKINCLTMLFLFPLRIISSRFTYQRGASTTDRIL